MFNKVILIGRLGKNAEVKTAQNKKDYAVLNLATSESWKARAGIGNWNVPSVVPMISPSPLCA